MFKNIMSVLHRAVVPSFWLKTLTLRFIHLLLKLKAWTRFYVVRIRHVPILGDVHATPYGLMVPQA